MVLEILFLDIELSALGNALVLEVALFTLLVCSAGLSALLDGADDSAKVWKPRNAHVLRLAAGGSVHHEESQALTRSRDRTMGATGLAGGKRVALWPRVPCSQEHSYTREPSGPQLRIGRTWCAT